MYKVNLGVRRDDGSLLVWSMARRLRRAQVNHGNGRYNSTVDGGLSICHVVDRAVHDSARLISRLVVSREPQWADSDVFL